MPHKAFHRDLTGANVKREQRQILLERLITDVCSRNLPIEVHAVYVFGSFARGALESNDLDVVIVHAPYENEEQEKERKEAIEWDGWRKAAQIARRHLTATRRRLVKPGEKVDLLFGTSLQDACRSMLFKPEDMKLVWSMATPNVKENLTAIVVNPAAGRFERTEFISPRRIGDRREVVEEVTMMLKRKELLLERVPLEEFVVKLTANYQRRLDWWNERQAMGRDALKCLPYGLQWMQSQRAGEVYVDGPTLHSKGWTRRVQMGRLSLWKMRWYFGRFREMKRQCLIPQMKRSELNELLVFERGPEWKKCDDAKIEPWEKTADQEE